MRADARWIRAAFALCLACSGCTSSEVTEATEAARADGSSSDSGADRLVVDQRVETRVDTATVEAGADSGPCVPGAKSLVCANATTVSFCTADTNFDGKDDGPPTTIEIRCEAFFHNVGAASCETFDATTTEALCTMDDSGPCGVILITGKVTSARCTTDDAVCLLDLKRANYVCTANTGLNCTPGAGFKPYCKGDRLVWRCTDDGDGIGQPYVDDCGDLGNGKCDAQKNACVDVQQGGQCNLTEWLCGAGLKCKKNKCVPK